MDAQQQARHTPDLLQLCGGFFKTGLSGFGGVLPHARRMLVEDRHWVSDQEFLDLLGLGQCLPGPNIVNISIVLGARFHGWQGSLAAVLGLMCAPLLIVLGLAALYAHSAQSATLQHTLSCVAAAAAGLMLNTGAKLAQRLERSVWTLMIAAAALLGVWALHLPLLLILAVLGPLALYLAWRTRR